MQTFTQTHKDNGEVMLLKLTWPWFIDVNNNYAISPPSKQRNSYQYNYFIYIRMLYREEWIETELIHLIVRKQTLRGNKTQNTLDFGADKVPSFPWDLLDLTMFLHLCSWKAL